MNLDQYDIVLLSFLQSHGRATHQQIAEHVRLSSSQIGRRIQRLESIGVITGYRVLLCENKIGLNVMAFTSLKLKHHSDCIVDRFQLEISVFSEVLECYAVAGDTDYMLRIIAGSLQDLSKFVMKKLMRVPGVDSIQSNVVMTTFKRDGLLPLDRAQKIIGGLSSFERKEGSL